MLGCVRATNREQYIYCKKRSLKARGGRGDGGGLPNVHCKRGSSAYYAGTSNSSSRLFRGASIPALPSNYFQSAYRSYCSVHALAPLESNRQSSCLPAALALGRSALGNFALYNKWLCRTWGMFPSKTKKQIFLIFLQQQHRCPASFSSGCSLLSLVNGQTREMSFMIRKGLVLVPGRLPPVDCAAIFAIIGKI